METWNLEPLGLIVIHADVCASHVKRRIEYMRFNFEFYEHILLVCLIYLGCRHYFWFDIQIYNCEYVEDLTIS